MITLQTDIVCLSTSLTPLSMLVPDENAKYSKACLLKASLDGIGLGHVPKEPWTPFELSSSPLWFTMQSDVCAWSWISLDTRAHSRRNRRFRHTRKPKSRGAIEL